MELKIYCILRSRTSQIYVVCVNDALTVFHTLDEAYYFGYECMKSYGVEDILYYSEYFYEVLEITSYEGWNKKLSTLLIINQYVEEQLLKVI